MTKSQKRRSDEEAFARTMLRAWRRFVVECPNISKHWAVSIIIFSLLLWCLFAAAGAPHYLDSLFAGGAFAVVIASILSQRKQFSEEKKQRAHKEEMEEAYNLIDTVHKRVLEVSVTDEEPIKSSVVDFMREKGYHHEESNVRTDGVYAFSILSKRIEKYLSLLNSKDVDAEKLTMATSDLYINLEIVSGAAYVFAYTYRKLAFECKSLKENEINNFYAIFASSFHRDVWYMLYLSQIGSNFYPWQNDFAKRMASAAVEGRYMQQYKPQVREAFIFALKARFYDRGNENGTAETIMRILRPTP